MAKRRAWEKIVLIFCDSGDTEEKKKILGSTLQKKWKSLRDHFVRELKKIKNIKSGSDASKKSSYVYFSRLTFLRPTIKKNATDSNFEIGEAENSQTSTENDADIGFQSPAATQCTKKLKLHPADEHFANIIQKSLAARRLADKKQDDDEDKLFCSSLVNDIQKVPENMRLKLKIEIYNLILQHQTTRPQQISYNRHPIDTTLSRNYASTSYDQQYIPRPGYSHQSYTTSYDTHSYPSHTTYSSSQSSQGPNVVIHGNQFQSTPSPAYTIPSETCQDSEIDLFNA